MLGWIIAIFGIVLVVLLIRGSTDSLTWKNLRRYSVFFLIGIFLLVILMIIIVTRHF